MVITSGDVTQREPQQGLPNEKPKKKKSKAKSKKK